MHIVCQNGHDSIVKCLITSGADINAVEEVSCVV